MFLKKMILLAGITMLGWSLVWPLSAQGHGSGFDEARLNGSGDLETHTPTTVGSPDPAWETRDEMLRIGNALKAYLSQFGANSAFSQSFCVWDRFPFDRTERPVISHADLTALLVPEYINALPEFDAWGQPYEFQLKTEEPADLNAVAVLSPGSDGIYEAVQTYDGAYTSNPEDDLIWADYFFVRQPPIPPNFYRAQAEETLREIGASLRSWLWDQTGGPQPAVTSDPEVTLEPKHLTDRAEILDALMPVDFFFYTRCVPEIDPWGRNYDYYVNSFLLDDRVLAILSAGADSIVESKSYDRQAVVDPNGDLVWSDGVFFRYPALFVDGFESGDTTAWSKVLP